MGSAEFHREPGDDDAGRPRPELDAAIDDAIENSHDPRSGLPVISLGGGTVTSEDVADAVDDE